MSRETIPALLVVTIVAAVAAQSSGCLQPREREAPRHDSNCTTCHGSPVRPGDELSRSAPPVALDGSTDPQQPGVGAHLIHLLGNDLHDGVACSECHVVPEQTETPGHADTELPAEVTFGELAQARGFEPTYIAATHRCTDTYCHLGAEPDWLPDQSPEARCERCHAMPPAPPHPAANDCSLCHGEVVDAAQRIIDPSRHVDGRVDVEERCDTCHGTGTLGAPPPSLTGATDPSALGVGAHAIHLEGSGNSRPLACDECHRVPQQAGDPDHLDGALPAEVMLSGVAASQGRSPAWDRNTRRCVDSWCHGPSTSTASPLWTAPGDASCQSCHGMPPAPPHPQMERCSICHGPVIDGAGDIAEPLRHVDGIVDVEVPVLCNACHGNETSAAPPADLAGNTATSFAGVGAHRTHLEGTGIARPVLCEECHQVPNEVLDAGHVDSDGPAEVMFSGVARAFGASPSYDGQSCADTYCHGGSFPFGHASGGMDTEPVWTDVQPGSLFCNSCHGLPPPPPHPPGPVFCDSCHSNVGTTLQILDPLTHVNGVVDF